MRLSDVTDSGIAHGSFSQILRGKFIRDEFTRKNGFVLAITGAPGAGKTSLALYLLHDLFADSLEQGAPGSAYMLSLVENPEQIRKIAQLYGLSFKVND